MPEVAAPEPEVASTSRPRGFDAIRDERARALETVRYRLTGGAQGIAPAGHVAAERRSIVGGAAARIMRKASGPVGGGQIPKSTGSPLPADVKAKMEPKLGADLSGVRLHTGSESAHAATNFGARAFTVGNDIHFNAGQFAPGSKEGDKLLAHELTHVVQTGRSGVQRKAEEDDSFGEKDVSSRDVSEPDEPAEKEADAVGERVGADLHDDRTTKRTDSKPQARPPTITANLDGVARKVYRSMGPPPATAPPAASSSDEQWCRSMLTMVPNLDVNAPGTLQSIESIGRRFKNIQATCGALPIYSQLGQAIQTKLSQIQTVGTQSIQQLITFVQGLPPRPATAGAGGSPAPAGPGTAPPGAPLGVAGASQVAPGSAATGGLMPALPPGMTPQTLQQMIQQRNQWLAANPQRIDPNAGATPGIRIWGQNTVLASNGQVSRGGEGHIMGTNTVTGAHSSFTGAETNRHQRNQNAAAAGMPTGNQPGTFIPPFPGANPQQAQVLSGGLRTLGGDSYLGKPMDFDFTLSQQFLQSQNPQAMVGFDQSVNMARAAEAGLLAPGAAQASAAGQHAANEFRLGTMQLHGQQQPAARTSNVQAIDGQGQAHAVPTTQAQNCGTDLMRRLFRLRIIDGTDLAMLGADQNGNFLPNCDLTPQALADHLRWKQAMWEQQMQRLQQGGRS
jgi:hypothetical protein